MSLIDDSTLINRLMIPGANAANANEEFNNIDYKTSILKTQNLDTTGLLEAGVRVLDERLCVNPIMTGERL